MTIRNWIAQAEFEAECNYPQELRDLNRTPKPPRRYWKRHRRPSWFRTFRGFFRALLFSRA